jgi:tRNA wybutosine-synthesizing protein 4
MFATYEQIRPFDAFGKIMIENLRRRGCELRGLEAHPTIQAEEDRFKRLGWSNSHALDLNDIYNHVIPKEEIQRIEKLELFDEFEEWHLISAHYCICVSTLNSSTLNLDQIAFMSIPNTSSRTS